MASIDLGCRAYAAWLRQDVLGCWRGHSISRAGAFGRVIRGGIRYSHDEAKNPIVSGTTLNLPTMQSDKFAPRVVVRYTPTDDSSVYASWSRGFKSGFYNVVGFPGFTLDQATVSPETIDAYEVGYKYASRGLSFDLASYYYDYKDLRYSGFSAGPIRRACTYGNNVTDTDYRTVLQATQAGIGNVWGAPATYGAEVKARF